MIPFKKTYVFFIILLLYFPLIVFANENDTDKEMYPLTSNMIGNLEVFKQQKRIGKKDIDRKSFLYQTFSYGGNIESTAGLRLGFFYERHLFSKYFWFTGYRFHSDSANNDEEDVEFDNNLLIRGHFFHLGLKVYPFNYEWYWKPYCGLGMLLGVNRYQIEYLGEEDDFDQGIAYGSYGVIGIRWGRRVVRFSNELHFGVISADFFGEQKSSSFFEFSFNLGFQF